MKNREFITREWIKCPYCGYNNKEENIKRYGTCTGCRQIIDEKAKYNYEMTCRLKLWRGRKRK